MDTKKLEKWAELLLDTGKRNNLIHFRDTRTSTVEVLLPSADVLLDKMDGSNSFSVYDPKIVEDEDEGEEETEGEGEQPEEIQVANKEEYRAQYAGKIKKQNQMLLYHRDINPMVALKSITKKARGFIEETGVNVAYMAFGWIHWKERESSDSVFRAPILLIPIELKQASAVDPYFIKASEDEIIVNPTFSYKMEAEYGVKLPDYEDEGLVAYLEKVRKLVSKLQWTVTAECKIGIFSFQKINMYRDLKDHATAILSNANVRQLLGESNGGAGGTGGGGDSQRAWAVKNPLIDLHSVVDADSSQMEAIEMAKSGKSFILQGPPGTGKSQTITNIIAECLNDGKKVLFVSEKLAALNVVYDKLKQVGLSEFCLELHSHKVNKKAVIADICRTLRMDKSAVSAKAEAEITAKEKARKQLDAYAVELHKPRPVIAKSLYAIYEAFSARRSAPDVEWFIPRLSERDEGYLVETSALLEQYVEFIPSIGYDYRRNNWYGYIAQDTSYQAKAEVKKNLSAAVEMLRALMPVAVEVFQRYGVECDSLDAATTWARFFSFVAESPWVTPALLKKQHLAMTRMALEPLKAESAQILSCRATLDAMFDRDIEEVDGATHHKKLTRQFSSAFSRLFNAEYKQIMTELRMCKKDGKKLSYNEAVATTETLSLLREKKTEFQRMQASIEPLMGEAYRGVDTDWDDMAKQLNSMQEWVSHIPDFGQIMGYTSFDEEREHFATVAKKMEQILAQGGDALWEQIRSYYDRAIFDGKTEKLERVADKLGRCLDSMERMENWCHFRAVLSELNEQEVVPFIHTAIAQNVEPKWIVKAFERQFYGQWMDRVISNTPVLSMFNRIAQDKAIRTFVEKDTEQFEINKAKIRAKLSSVRPSMDMVARGSAVATLLREGEKKRKQKSIRSLLSEVGEVVQCIKPCFLMSPLSVSTFLASGAVHFDVVVFDEASQIFPQDAIGAVYRADQMIVVGDSRQMPPSNFFNATAEKEDTDEETGDVTDFESILDLCSTSMPQLRLRWHYRSRYEQLITFSNKNYYDNALITFPSSKMDQQGVGVDYYHVDGVFDRKTHTNRIEAEYVVDLIYQNIEKYPNRSLGVVAFSVAQQDLIDQLLSKRRQNTPEKEFFFNDEEKSPFFVKNLETVQGDERDTILFSIAYGQDAQGRLLHNFGPLNRAGGERRLNVAVTRAKCNVQVVSSMHCTDIDLKRTSAEGARLLREYLDFAENGHIALERAISVKPFEQFDSDFELEVCEFLRNNGFEVDTQVGCSGFRIDLGLKVPNSSDYVLAIECDGATYHSSKNARDRDRLRQEILERMGWTFYRIWSTDWFRNQAVEKQRLLEAATKAVQLAKVASQKPTEQDQDEETEQIEQIKDDQQIREEVKEEVKEETKEEINEEVKGEVKKTSSFEEVAVLPQWTFPPYRKADDSKLSKQFLPHDFKGWIRAILEVEAPLSEELLLKRIVWAFGREKVTRVVQQSYEEQMKGYQQRGIVRRNGFLYLADTTSFALRGPGDWEREIRQIAPEELAAGMLEILRQNRMVDKAGLYRTLVQQCGISRVSKTANEYLDRVLQLLDKDVNIEGEQVTLK